MAVSVCLGACVPAIAGQVPSDSSSFIAAARLAGRRLEDPGVAIAEGYRKLGPDFPGMGEHWINPGLVIAGELDPERPPVLCYTTIGSERRLIALAFTRVLGPDEDPPDGPLPADAWHDHTGGVDEESLLLTGPVSMDTAGQGFRLAMVHVWIPEENPAGVFAQNNWALPFLRAGLAVPPSMSREAARALSLSGDGTAFYEHLLRQGIGLSGANLDGAITVFARASRTVDDWVENRRGRAEHTSRDLIELEGIWYGLWRDLRDTLSEEAYGQVSILGPG